MFLFLCLRKSLSFNKHILY